MLEAVLGSVGHVHTSLLLVSMFPVAANQTASRLAVDFKRIYS